ncbi:MAG: hypothetical protein AB1452_15000 [Pseudomonadota bacterium]
MKSLVFVAAVLAIAMAQMPEPSLHGSVAFVGIGALILLMLGLALLRRRPIESNRRGVSDPRRRLDERLRAARRLGAGEVNACESARDAGVLEAHDLPGQITEMLGRRLRADGGVAAAYLARVRGRQTSAFRAYLLVIRVDPRFTELDVSGRALGFALDLIDPPDLIWVRGYYTSESIKPELALALAAVPSSVLFNTLPHDRPYAWSDWRPMGGDGGLLQ